MLYYVTNSDTGDYIEDMAEEYEDKPPITYSEFDKQIATLYDDCYKRLAKKDVEYGHSDAFKSFKNASKVANMLPENVALMYRLKHDMSLRKLLDDIQIGGQGARYHQREHGQIPEQGQDHTAAAR